MKKYWWTGSELEKEKTCLPQWEWKRFDGDIGVACTIGGISHAVRISPYPGDSERDLIRLGVEAVQNWFYEKHPEIREARDPVSPEMIGVRSE